MSIYYETTDVSHVTEGQLTKGVCIGVSRGGREVIIFAPDAEEIVGFLSQITDYTLFGTTPRPSVLVPAQNLKPKEQSE